MEAETKIVTPKKQPWGALASLVVSFSAYAISQYVVLGIVLVFGGIYGASQVESSLSEPWVSLVIAGISALVLLAVVWLFLKTRHVRIRDLGFYKPTLRGIGTMLTAYGMYFVALIITITAVSALFPAFNVDQVQDIGFTDATGWQLLLAFLGLVIVAPIAEEIFFRGFLYKGLARSWPKWVAAIVASALFGLAHLQWNVGIDTFILSLLLIYVLEKTGNLWLCIGLHSIKNLIAFLALFIFAR